MSAAESANCAEMEALLAERASGPLEAEEALTLERHLASCARCRASASGWDGLFSLVSLPPVQLKEEAAMRDFPQRTLLAWERQQRSWRRMPQVAASALLAAAAVLLVLWHNPHSLRAPVAQVAVAADFTESQVDWTDGPTWEMDEADATELTADDAELDGLALEGDGAFSLGDSG
jgi:anti-sigma factor RsiW